MKAKMKMPSGSLIIGARLEEKWKWTSGCEGTSVIEEL
jgi:hypothetical protein